jgi:FolB domain-containing protein
MGVEPVTRAQLDVIAIERLTVDCIVGLYPHEREIPQPLQLDVRMFLDTEKAGISQRLRRTVDYAAVATQLAFLLQHCRFQMLETAAHALARYLLAPPARGEDRARVRATTLRLTKPSAFGGRGVPSLEIHRSAAGLRLGSETKAWGTVDVIHEIRDHGIYRLNIAPGQRIPLHVHRQMREAELTLGEGLVVNGQPVPAGTSFRWPHDVPHVWQNPTERWQSILCVDAPAFVPGDEIEVPEREAGPVTAEPPFLPPPPLGRGAET